MCIRDSNKENNYCEDPDLISSHSLQLNKRFYKQNTKSLVSFVHLVTCGLLTPEHIWMMFISLLEKISSITEGNITVCVANNNEFLKVNKSSLLSLCEASFHRFVSL